MSVANTKASASFQEALAATKSLWEETSVGLVEKSEGGGLNTIIKQFNTALYLLVRLDNKVAEVAEKIDRLNTRVSNIEKAKGPDISSAIDDISEKLARIKVSDGKVIRETGGNLKVFKNPFEILKEQQK